MSSLRVGMRGSALARWQATFVASRLRQLAGFRRDLDVCFTRGNVDTRVRTVGRGEYQAVVLAKAGLERLQLSQKVTAVLDPQELLPAVGQGTVVLESRNGDQSTRDELGRLHHPESHVALVVERSLLAELEGECLVPLGARARIHAGRLHMDAGVFSPDGSRSLHVRSQAVLSDAAYLGRKLARDLLQRGAAQLLTHSRSE